MQALRNDNTRHKYGPYRVVPAFASEDASVQPSPAQRDCSLSPARMDSLFPVSMAFRVTNEIAAASISAFTLFIARNVRL